MKKIYGILSFGLMIAFFPAVVLAVSPTVVPSAGVAVKNASPSSVSTPEPVEYVLPYPGILPTHPLYIFKSFRDNIIEWLITDPLNKAEFYVLQADKKLNMGITLRSLQKGKEADAAFAEALILRTQTIATLEKEMQSGRIIPGHFVEKVLRSLVKHKEVLEDAGKKTDAVDALRERVQQGLGESH